MIAYATVFLVKVTKPLQPRLNPANTVQLLVSAPNYIRSEMERPAIEAIRNAAKTLAEQAAPPNTGCALQANFLYNVALEYETSHEPQRRSKTYRRNPSHVDDSRTAATAGRTSPLYVRTDGLSQDVQDIETPAMGSIQNPQDTPLSDGADPLANDEIWAVIFANAGFNVDAGAFMLPS